MKEEQATPKEQTTSIDREDDTEMQARGRSRKKAALEGDHHKIKRVGIIMGVIILGILLVTGGAYAYQAQQYKQVFFPNTMINGMDASGKEIVEIKRMIESGMEGYTLTIDTRGGQQEQIVGQDIDLHAEYDGTLEQILTSQNPYSWGLHHFEESSYRITTMMAYDQALLEQKLKDLDCMDSTMIKEPKDAYLSEYIAGKGYQVIPEEQGDLLIYDTMMQRVSEAILNLGETLSLEELGAYEVPKIFSTDPDLNGRAKAWNHYVTITVTHQFGEQREVLDGATIHTWLSADQSGAVALNEEKVTAYVKTLADKYNTAYKNKVLKTSYGPTVTINKGNYGWRINQGAETAAVIEILRSGESQSREPIYTQTAASHSGKDYGDTYVEINLTAQHLYFYKNGSLLVESDFVSGNETKGWSTPAGAYPLTYKERDATLNGEGYATPVSYWMPFNGGIGMHDAGWRSSFGGSIYKTGGSHGCINLPPSVAKTIYENISKGIPVLCYHLDGTGKGSSSIVPEATTAPQATTAASETTAPQPTTAAPQETTTAETTAAPIEPPTSAIEVSPVQPETSAPQIGNPDGSTTDKTPIGPDAGSSGSGNGAVSGPGM